MNKKINIKQYCKFPEVQNGEPPYIGLKIEESKKDFKRFNFIFPVSYYKQNEQLTDEILRTDIKNLLKAIYKANSSEVYNNDKIQKDICPIDAYLWIIKNYLENGYYIEKEIVYTKNNSGKINWKKTIKNNEFFIDNNYNVIYTQFITQRRKNDINNIITCIHRYCVYNAVKQFGFLYNIDLESVELCNIDMKTQEITLILRNEYNNSFLDSKKELLMNMIKMLEWLGDKKSGYDMFSISDSKFQLIFEKLINERFGNVENIEKYYPFAFWNINGKEYKSSELREDTIIETEKAIYIIDAKYYKYAYLSSNNVNTLPTTSSIAKQIIYGEYVQTLKTKKQVYNVFLIPFNKEKEEQYIEYVGYAGAEWRKENKTFDKIYTFKIDLKTLVNDTFGTKEKNINELIKKIGMITIT